MLRYVSSFVIAAYEKVRLTPQDSRALPAELFTKPSNLVCFLTFYEFCIFIVKRREVKIKNLSFTGNSFDKYFEL